MQRIIIVGCPGSGKSRLSKILSQKLNLPLVHLDQIFWEAGWNAVSKEVFKQRLLYELEKERWILDGNFASTLELRLKYCDHVIFMNYPTLTCLLRVLKRVRQNKGKTRPDMTEGCEEKLDLDFLKYIKSFKKTKLPKMRAILEKASVPVTEIKNDNQLKKFLKTLENNAN